MKRILVVIGMVFVCVMNVSAQEDTKKEPEALTKAREAYQKAVVDVVIPLKQKYLKELQTLQDVLTKSGKLQEALAVQSEVKAVMEELAAATPEKPTMALTSKRNLKVRMWVDVAPAGATTTFTIARDKLTWPSGGGVTVRDTFVDGKATAAAKVFEFKTKLASLKGVTLKKIKARDKLEIVSQTTDTVTLAVADSPPDGDVYEFELVW